VYNGEPSKMLSERDPHPPRKHVEGGEEGCRVSSYLSATQPNRLWASRTVLAKSLDFERLILGRVCGCATAYGHEVPHFLSLSRSLAAPFWPAMPLALQRSCCWPTNQAQQHSLVCPWHADQALIVWKTRSGNAVTSGSTFPYLGLSADRFPRESWYGPLTQQTQHE
jgi:hypothetical protein